MTSPAATYVVEALIPIQGGGYRRDVSAPMIEDDARTRAVELTILGYTAKARPLSLADAKQERLPLGGVQLGLLGGEGE